MEINNRKIIIHWEQGHGKTLFWVFLAFTYTRIYSNVDITYNNKKINIILSKIEEFETLFNYNSIPGVTLLDETWINFNSKKGMSQANETLQKWFFLSRKYNVTPIFIAQRFGSVPVDMRELASKYWIIEMKKVHRKRYAYPLFTVNMQTVDNEWALTTHKTFEIDLIKFFDTFDIKYDTLQSSLIT